MKDVQVSKSSAQHHYLLGGQIKTITRYHYVLTRMATIREMYNAKKGGMCLKTPSGFQFSSSSTAGIRGRA